MKWWKSSVVYQIYPKSFQDSNGDGIGDLQGIRIVSRWGNDKECRVLSAKMLATILHGMKGTPYIYQGEELAMTNAPYEIEDYLDIETLNMYHERMASGYSKEEIMRSIHARGRDNARTCEK